MCLPVRVLELRSRRLEDHSISPSTGFEGAAGCVEQDSVSHTTQSEMQSVAVLGEGSVRV